MAIQRIKCTRWRVAFGGSLLRVCVLNNVSQVHLHALLHCMQCRLQALMERAFNVVVQFQRNPTKRKNKSKDCDEPN